MAILTVQKVTLAGLEPTFAAATETGDLFPNSGREFIYVKNSSAGALTVTVNSQTACNQGYDHDETVSVPAGKERMIGPFPKSRFDNADGRVQLTYSAGVTSLTIAVVQVP